MPIKKNLGVINVMDFGAKGDGVTDDTAAIRKAILACEKGMTLNFPSSSSGYLVKHQSVSDTEILYIEKPIAIVGNGVGSSILVDGSVPATCDVIRINPDPAKGTDGYSIDGLTIVASSGKPARHCLNLELTRSGFSRMKLKNNFFYYTGGYSLYLTNPTKADGFFTSQIEKNLMFGGLFLDGCGDSVIVRDNTLAGDNGVVVSLINGSKEFVFENNNVTLKKGVILKKGNSCKFRDNNFEVAYADSVFVNNAYLDIDGSDETASYGMLGIEVTGNDFTYRATAPDGVVPLRINKSRRCFVENNVINRKNSNLLEITALAQNTDVGYNLYSYTDPSGGALIVDNGLGTIKRDVHVDTASAEHDVFMVDAPSVRRRGTLKQEVFQNTILESLNTGISSLQFLFKEGNANVIKHILSSGRRSSTGALDSLNDVLYLLADKVAFPSIGYAVRDQSNNYHRVLYLSAAPTTGTWAVGDIVYNQAPSAGGKLGWVCVTAGTPGTWKGFGSIDA